MTHTKKVGKYYSLLLGVAFTFIIASIGFSLASLPGFQQIGSLSVAIVLAILYRHFFGFPERIRAGIQFSAKRLLRLAIILFGLKLNINVILDEGFPLMLRDLLVVAFSIGVMMLLAKLLKADQSLSILLGIGTGVCGASAIAAVSPILKAKEEDTALSAGIISLIGTIFAIVYTIIRPILPMEAVAYGMWSGLSLHEVAHVVLAGKPAGENALAMALLAKLGRVFLLIPLSIILIWIMNRKKQNTTDHKIPFPWFLVGFLIMSIIGSFVLGTYISVSNSVTDGVSIVTSYILTMAMVGLGLNVSLHDLRQRAFKPVIAVVLTSILLAIATSFIV